MTTWIKPLRLPVCFLASLLAIVGFRASGISILWPAVISVLFIASATMLQNDYRDRCHDSHKGKLLATQHPNIFLVFLLIFWTGACILILITLLQERSAGIVLVIMALLGLIYSEFRKIPLTPIMLVAFTSASPVLLALGTNVDKNNTIILIFLSSAFIIFGREITKDLDDKQIDIEYKWTIPLAIGDKKSRTIAASTILIGLVIIAKISLITWPALLIATMGAILLIRGSRPRITRIYLNIGMALMILIYIISQGA